MCHRFRSAYHYTNEEKLSALYQLLQYRHNVRLRWSKLDTSLQHPHNFPRFLLNLSDGMLTRQHQTISVDYVFPLYIFFCYRKHILYQKYTLPAVVQFNDIENVARFPGLFFFLHNPSIFVNAAGQWIIQYILVLVSSKNLSLII